MISHTKDPGTHFPQAIAVADAVGTRSPVEVWLAAAAMSDTARQEKEWRERGGWLFNPHPDANQYQSKTSNAGDESMKHAATSEAAVNYYTLAAEQAKADGELRRETEKFTDQIGKLPSTSSRDHSERGLVLLDHNSANVISEQIWKTEREKNGNEDAIEMNAAPVSAVQTLHDLERALALWLRPVLKTVLNAHRERTVFQRTLQIAKRATKERQLHSNPKACKNAHQSTDLNVLDDAGKPLRPCSGHAAPAPEAGQKICREREGGGAPHQCPRERGHPADFMLTCYICAGVR